MGPGTINSITEDGNYMVKLSFGLWTKVSKQMLETQKQLSYKQGSPSITVIDNFYNNPDEIRDLALIQDYKSNIQHYKGKRTEARFLFPSLKEKFEKILGVEIKNWLNHAANGVFQITNNNDPLVWHCDQQSYAAAIYLSKNGPINAGTSFWRDRKFKVRRDLNHPDEKLIHKYSDQELHELSGNVFTQYNITHEDNWELVDNVGSIYNRLVIWDAKLIHSASSYTDFTNQVENSRLVQLFFFDV